MSLLGTLAKVAVGVAVAKGVKGMAGGNRQQQGQAGQQQMGGGLGGILGQLAKSAVGGRGLGGGLGGLLGGLLGGGGRSAGGLGGLLGGLLGGGGAKAQQSGGGLPGGGNLGGLFDALAGPKKAETGGQPGFGDLLNQSLEKFSEPDAQPTADQEQTAAIMLRCMIQAAKSDGEIDDKESQAIMGNLTDATEEDIEFLKKAVEEPVNPELLAKSIPEELKQQAYMMSLVAIDLDSKKEAEYLHTFATALGLDKEMVNAIHQKMDEPALYS